MTIAEWIAFGQMLTGMLGVGLVGLGLQQMRRAGDQREKREDARHREAMAAIDARHRESMRALEALIKGLDRQTEALKVVIERTAPPPRETL